MLDTVSTRVHVVAGDTFEQHATFAAEAYAVVFFQRADNITNVLVCSQTRGFGVASETANQPLLAAGRCLLLRAFDGGTRTVAVAALASLALTSRPVMYMISDVSNS